MVVGRPGGLRERDCLGASADPGRRSGRRSCRGSASVVARRRVERQREIDSNRAVGLVKIPWFPRSGRYVRPRLCNRGWPRSWAEGMPRLSTMQMAQAWRYGPRRSRSLLIPDRPRGRAEAALAAATSSSNLYPLAAGRSVAVRRGWWASHRRRRRADADAEPARSLASLALPGRLEEVLADSGVASSRDGDVTGLGRRTDHGRRGPARPVRQRSLDAWHRLMPRPAHPSAGPRGARQSAVSYRRRAAAPPSCCNPE